MSADDTFTGRPPPHIVVVGSLNLDLVARVRRLPRPGETVRGSEFLRIPGGKGANQAIAVAKLGGRCSMVGRVGDDGFGGSLRAALESQGVNVEHVFTTAGCSSGVAMITVEESGQNVITVVAGANGRLTAQHVRNAEALIASSDALLVQLEVPLEAVEEALRIARSNDVLTLLNPAPAPTSGLPPELFEVDVLTPNQSEAEALTGIAAINAAGAERAARALRDRGARCVVVTLGKDGAMICDETGQCRHIPAFSVAVVDTTAAGDAFAAAMALGTAEGLGPTQAVRFGCAAGALAATKMGAQPALPERMQVERLLGTHQ